MQMRTKLSNEITSSLGVSPGSCFYNSSTAGCYVGNGGQIILQGGTVQTYQLSKYCYLNSSDRTIFCNGA